MEQNHWLSESYLNDSIPILIESSLECEWMKGESSSYGKSDPSHIIKLFLCLCDEIWMRDTENRIGCEFMGSESMGWISLHGYDSSGWFMDNELLS